MQGLIQVSAACLNRRRGHLAAARRQARRGARLVETAALELDAHGHVLGFDAPAFAGRVRRHFADRDAGPDPPPPIVLDL